MNRNAPNWKAINWNAVGAISNFVAAIAIVFTLAYLAIQIRQNTSALRSTTTQAVHDQASDFYDMLASDSSLVTLLSEGLETPDKLTETEMARFFSVLFSVCFRMQNWYYQTELDVIDEAAFESWTYVTTRVAVYPGFQHFWNERKDAFVPAFRGYFEEKMHLAKSDSLFQLPKPK